MGHVLPVGTRATVRVPATSANLGPAFDAAGLALRLHDQVTVTVADHDVAVSVTGEGAGSLPTGADHLVAASVLCGLDAAGVAAPGLHVECVNRIPHGRGLGSSAAAVVAGLVAARELARSVLDEPAARTVLADLQLLELATDREGHPDNAAACLFGGLTLAWCEGGRPQALALPPAADLATVVLVPGDELATRQARALLPPTVPHADATATVGRAALLATAVTGRLDLLPAATRDWLHQDYRRPAMPASLALVDALRDRGWAATVSGAGPTVLVLLRAAEADGLVADLPVEAAGFAASVLTPDRTGVAVLPRPVS